MSSTQFSSPAALVASAVEPNKLGSILPAAFAARAAGRQKRRLGDQFGLTQFGVNLVRIEPGGISSIRHFHMLQDEFIYVLQGHPILNTNAGQIALQPGMCAGFKAGTGLAHNLANETTEDVWYLEVGDRSPGDAVVYPEEDLQGQFVAGKWVFSHKDGTPY